MVDALKIGNSQIILVAVGLVIYVLYGAVHRLFFSQIAAFPGPKWAALTFWYEFYYDVYPHYGQYTFHIRELHAKYGPIVRINPRELHIQSPEFYETLYSANSKRDKWNWFMNSFGNETSMFTTIEHVLHRQRRAALNPYFSPASVRKLQPIVQAKVDEYVERLRELKVTRKVIRCVVSTAAYSNDVIRTYAFGRSYDLMQVPDFGVARYDAMHQGTEFMVTVKHIPIMFTIANNLPKFILDRAGFGLKDVIQERADICKQVQETFSDREKNVETNISHRTLFNELLDSNLPRKEVALNRLTDEAHIVVNAGTETTAWTLAVATYHLLADHKVLRKLKTELAEAIPEPNIDVPQIVLEKLPYLAGVIKEALRLSYGASGRLHRVAHEPLKFSTTTREWVIPAGVPCSMSSALLHHDEKIFPSSKSFLPERWIEDPYLDRYLVSFSKGSRQCLGMHLGQAEICLWLSGVFRRFGSKEVRFESDEGILELVDTTIEDVEIWADRFIPAVKPGSLGVQFRVLP